MEAWHYPRATGLDLTMLERLRRFPRQPEMLVYGLRWLAALALRGWLATYHRLQIVGRENLPADDTSFVMIANHANHLDVLCLLAALPLGRLHRTFPAAAQDYFFTSGPRALAASIVVNALPFDRKARQLHSLAACTEVLETPGNVLILFPEGTRSGTGEMGDFKPGIGTLVAGRRLPVVPCYLDGAHAAWPKGAWLPRPRRLRLTIGRPSEYADRGRDKSSVAQICQDLHSAVRELAAP